MGKMIVIVGLLLGMNVGVKAQDLFARDNSYKFADYLYGNFEFKLAEMEYQRLFFADKSDSLAAVRYFLCNYKLENYKENEKVYLKFVKPLDEHPFVVDEVFIRSLVLLNSPELSLELDEIKPLHADYYNMTHLMLNSEWDKAREVSAHSDDEWCKKNASILVLQDNLTYKKPGVAVALALAIPGAGKAYAGYWKDALFSFVFVSLSAWQSYRGFDKKGVESAYGWIYGGMATGFYIGDIFGSYKAVHKRNHLLNHELHHEVRHIFLDNSF